MAKFLGTDSADFFHRYRRVDNHLRAAGVQVYAIRCEDTIGSPDADRQYGDIQILGHAECAHLERFQLTVATAGALGKEQDGSAREHPLLEPFQFPDGRLMVGPIEEDVPQQSATPADHRHLAQFLFHHPLQVQFQPSV